MFIIRKQNVKQIFNLYQSTLKYLLNYTKLIFGIHNEHRGFNLTKKNRCDFLTYKKLKILKLTLLIQFKYAINFFIFLI